MFSEDDDGDDDGVWVDMAAVTVVREKKGSMGPRRNGNRGGGKSETLPPLALIAERRVAAMAMDLSLTM